VRGQDDGVPSYVSAGYPLGSVGPPTGFTVCDASDEISVPPSGIETDSPAGCQSEQMERTLRIYWEEPTDTGYWNGATVTMLAYTIQWSLDPAFITGVSIETCTDTLPHPTIGAGDVCDFGYRTGLIPKTGVLQATMQYYIRIAAVTIVGTGAFTAPILSPRVPYFPGPPRNLVFTRNYPELGDTMTGSDTFLTFAWDTPYNTGDGTSTLILVNYHIEMWTEDTSGDVTIVHSPRLGGTVYTYTTPLGSLSTGTTYYVRVVAENVVSYRADSLFGDVQWNSDLPGRTWSETMNFSLPYCTNENTLSQTGDGVNSVGECICNTGHTANGVDCTACDAGEFKDTFGPSYCSTCPYGTNSVSASTSVANCKCKPGFSGTSDGVACVACHIGTYKDVVGTGECLTCPVGTSSASASNLVGCTCNAGFTAVEDGVECTMCIQGTYKNATGAVECSACPAFTNSPPGSDAVVDCTCMNGYKRLPGVACTICPEDVYCIDGEQFVCPENGYSDAGSTNIEDCMCGGGYFH
jgi:hypothetical protein